MILRYLQFIVTPLLSVVAAYFIFPKLPPTNPTYLLGLFLVFAGIGIPLGIFLAFRFPVKKFLLAVLVAYIGWGLPVFLIPFILKNIPGILGYILIFPKVILGIVGGFILVEGSLCFFILNLKRFRSQPLQNQNADSGAYDKGNLL
jgi:hypothetical protein